MNRREVLLGMAAVGGGGYVAIDQFGDDVVAQVPEDVAKQASETPLEQSFSGFGPGFEKVAFDGRELTIYFAEDTDMDGWSLQHEYTDDVDEALRTGSAPDFGGQKTVDFAARVESNGATYPTPNFQLTAYKGEFSEAVALWTDKLGSVGFTVPERIGIENIQY